MITTILKGSLPVENYAKKLGWRTFKTSQLHEIILTSFLPACV
jgi:hypothetical protein